MLLTSILLFISGPSIAQDFPTKPVSVIVPVNPGSIQDSLARIVGSEMAKVLGQPFVVENKPGANSLIGAEYVAMRAPADGHTIFLAQIASLVALPALFKDIKFEPLKDLSPVIALVEGRYVFGSSAKLPWKTLDELITHAKANPGKLNYATASPLGTLQTGGFLRDLGLNIVHIPYTGAGGPYTQAIVNGEVHMVFTAAAQAISFGDKFRVLGVTGESRRPPLMGVPTFAELGHPEIPGLAYSINARGGTPANAVERLRFAATKALQEPGVRDTLVKKMQQDIISESLEATSRRYSIQAKYFAELAKKIGYQPGDVPKRVER